MAGVIIAGAQAIGTAFVQAAPQIAAAAAQQALQYALTPSQTFRTEGPRLAETQFTSSTEGAPIPRVYGRYRVGGQVIWMTRFEEEIITETTSAGGKGGPKNTQETTTYNYYANIAIALCEGETGQLGRVWFDAKETDLSQYVHRFYKGTETQNPDPLIQAKEGSANAPAFRGVSYVVFERLPITDFGNRVPQMMFEIYRPVTEDGIEDLISGVNLIPGSTEFGYDPDVITRHPRPQVTVTENAHIVGGRSDWDNSIDQLADTLPSLGTVCLVVAWFGTDLRAGECEIRPKVENDEKITTPHSWYVAGLDRQDAEILSQVNGGPAFGGSPNDASIIRAIQDLKARGYQVMMYPFILMDIPAGNSLPNPYSNNASSNGQSIYPWRGRITCSPAPGYSGTVDKTSAAQTQINSFYGSATASHFSGTGTEVNYSGPNEWTYSRFILHLAQICKQAGGVSHFCIGTEMVNLTTVRSTASNFPFVEKLRTLATQVTSLLPTAKIGYAADWSEYHSYRPGDGTGDVYFHLDRLWAWTDIDFVGIDNYLPISDWRSGDSHLDAQNYSSIYDVDYLKSNIEGGEYYDWFYASEADRKAQQRSNITDGQGKPWVFRNKDIRNWWDNRHYNRPNGVESGSPTGWLNGQKPIIFTELGCPAIDKGSNQPNVFFDPKSSESAVPHFSNGNRDDTIQRRFLQANLEYWNENNVVATRYVGNMIDLSASCIWSWDARPWPSFPLDTETWADGPNWAKGHWINSRLGTVYVPDLIEKMADEYGFTQGDFQQAYGTCDGFVLDRVLSLRGAIQPLETLFAFNLIESGDKIKAVTRYNVTPIATVNEDNILLTGDDEDLISFTRTQEIDLPSTMRIGYIDSQASYKSAKVEAKRLAVKSTRIIDTSVPIITDFSRAQQTVNRMLYMTWGSRERSEFGLLPNLLKVEPGDVLAIDVDGFETNVRVGTVSDGTGRDVTGFSFVSQSLESSNVADRSLEITTDGTISAPTVLFLDIPQLSESNNAYAGYVAAYASPWPGTETVYRSPTDSNFVQNTTLNAPARIGETLTEFNSGPLGSFDYGNTLDIELYRGNLSSLDEQTFLSGGNALAIQNTSGEWEILQFQNAELIGQGQYRISKLLRGQLGTEHSMQDNLPAGQSIVMLDLAVYPINMSRDDVNKEFNYKTGPTNEPISSDLLVDTTFTYTGIGMRPYSPTDFNMIRESNSDLSLEWKRRTRIGGDDWDAEEVPVAEESEQYRLRIYDGSTVVHEVVTSQPNYVYTQTQQATDFGSAQSILDIEVSQYGSAYGSYGEPLIGTYKIIGAR